MFPPMVLIAVLCVSLFFLGVWMVKLKNDDGAERLESKNVILFSAPLLFFCNGGVVFMPHQQNNTTFLRQLL
jgi:hypothetical protein